MTFIQCGDFLRAAVHSIARKLVQVIRSPGTGLLFVSAGFLGLPAIFAAFFWPSAGNRFAAFILAAISLVFLAEIVFRLGYRAYMGEPYRLYPKLRFEDVYVTPHPYIPFVYKRNFKTEKRGPANYPLHRGRFFFGSYRTNNLGFANGYDGGRDIVVPKPQALFRVNCLGASTTGNYIEYEGLSYSYPLELEKILEPDLSATVEVNNCGQGGYNSADIMVRFALQIVDTDPDVVVIYHGYNDVPAYLTPEFMSDYSHVRRNLGDSYWKIALAAKVPFVPLKFANFLFNEWLPASIRHSLLAQVSKGAPDFEADPTLGLLTYERNLQHIIDLCRSRGIRVVLSTYCHFLYDAIRQEPLHLVYSGIVKRENDIMRGLAERNGLILVDNAALVPQEEKYFVDSIHFTPEGMKLIAANIASGIKQAIKETI